MIEATHLGQFYDEFEERHEDMQWRLDQRDTADETTYDPNVCAYCLEGEYKALGALTERRCDKCGHLEAE